MDPSEIQKADDVLLVSQDLGAWGTDRGQDVVELLRTLDRLPGTRRYAVESFEPTLFLEHFEALRPILCRGRFGWVALPIQSGSERVLRSMDRHYSPDRAIEAALELSAAGVATRTDVLYGFGDETEAEFEQSVIASRAFTFPSFNLYQPRPGTPPLTLPESTLRQRRDRVLEELYLRAQAEPIAPEPRVLAVQRARPVHEAPTPGRAHDTITPSGVPWPWQDAAGRRWIEETALRIGTFDLDDRCFDAQAGEDAVLVVARGEPGFVVALRPASWPGGAAVRTPQLALAARHEGELSPGLDRLFKRMTVHLTAKVMP